VSNFINQALKGRPLTVYGKGSQTRSFCYVSDLVRGIWAAISTPGTRGGVYNLGNPNETTILRFAKTVTALCGRKGARIVRSSLPVNDPTRRKPDISRAKRALKWAPKVTLQEGLRLTIDYYRGRIKGA
jgi:nucleoside-diphosphate-sugar epimerase